MSHFTGEWLRKAEVNEAHMEDTHQDGHLLIWYQLDLSTAQPLKDEDVKTTVEHMYKKVANLGVCYGTREGGEKWFRKPTNPEVDFKVHQGKTLDDVRDELRDNLYKSDTGPLFCVRLIKDCPDTGADYGDMEPSFPYKYFILFGLHHGMTDGTSNVYIMACFTSLVNQVVGGQPIDDEEPMGYFAPQNETNELIVEKITQLDAEPKLKQAIADDLQYMKDELPAIIKGFPTPKPEMVKTCSIVRVLDKASTSKLIQCCKQEKTSVNSAITALINVAIVDILVDSGINQDPFTIRHLHTVNLRRYWKPKSQKPLGLHMSFPLCMSSKTPKNTEGKFWDYAKEIHEGLKEQIVSGMLLTYKAFELLTPEVDHFAEITMAGDFITSSMGDVTPVITMGGDHVRVTNMVRGSTIHKIPIPMLINYHTFRGIFTLSIDYGTAAIEPAVAERLILRIMERITQIL